MVDFGFIYGWCPQCPHFFRESKCLMNFRVKIPDLTPWPLPIPISSSHGVQIVPDSPTNQSSHLMVTHQPQMLHWVSAKVRPTHSARNPWEFDLGGGSRLYQGSKIYVARIVMWLKQSWLPSPCHHHFYRWYGYHVTMPQSWVVYGPSVSAQASMVPRVSSGRLAKTSGTVEPRHPEKVGIIIGIIIG